MYGGARTRIRPASSDTSSRPSGRNFIAVGRSKPVASTSFWKKFVLATLTAMPEDSVELPAASRARAVSVWLPLVSVRVSHVRAYGAVVSSTPVMIPST